MAKATAPAVGLAKLRDEEARGRLEQARSVFFPTVRGTASFQRESLNSATFGIEFPAPPGETGIPDRIGPFDIWDIRVEAVQKLLDRSDWLRARAAERGVDAYDAEADTEAEDAAARTASSYVGAVRGQATLDARLREQTLARELLEVAERQLAAGVGTRLDVVRAKNQVAAATAAIELAHSELAQIRIELARSLGLGAGVEVVPTDVLAAGLGRSTAPETRDAAVAMALARRSELAALKARLAEATASAKAISAERLGSLELVADYGANGPEPGATIGTGRLEILQAIPLFEGFRLEGRRREQEARAAQARLELNETREAIVGEVESALAALASGEARQVAAREQQALAEEEVREAGLLFGNGLAGNIALVNAQADLVNANDTMIGALAQSARARIRLARAAGVAQSVE